MHRTLAAALAVVAGMALSACGGGSTPQPPTPPLVVATPSDPRPGQAVQLQATSSDPQGGAVSFAWAFGDGASAAGASASHAWAAEGTFSVQVVATGASGLTSTGSKAVVVTALAPANLVQAAPATGRPGEQLAFTVSATDPQSSAISYAWTFGDGTSATGASASHAYASEGTFQLQATATNAYGKSATSSTAIQVTAAPPSTPTLEATPSPARPGQVMSFSATSTDPQGSAPTFTWDFGDGSGATGAGASHAYASEGTYTVRVTAANAFGKSASATGSFLVSLPRPSVPVLFASTAAPLVGQDAIFTASSTDSGGLPVTYSWSFGDGAVASGASTTHAWSSPGSFTVSATATNSESRTASASLVVVVGATPPSSGWTVDCGGPSCGATSPSTCSGSGVGVWRYANTTGSPVTVDVSISGVRAGQTATLLFSNGGNTATSVPAAGTLAAPAEKATAQASLPPDPLREAEESAHEIVLRRNREVVAHVLRDRPSPGAPQPAAAPRVEPTPALGATRTWKDSFVSPAVVYTTVAQATCALPFGRTAVFWVDPASWAAGDVTSAALDVYKAAFCGASGGYGRVTAFLGDAWGSAADPFTYLIHDSPGAPLDVNVVFLGVPPGTGWGGYFWGGNNFLASAQASSNEALAFFVNAPNSRNSRNYYLSLLLHELTHMVNFHQRSVARGVSHDTWLEETSAMMSEDIVSPTVTSGYSPIPGQRVAPYLAGGGNVSLVNWATLSSGNYALGGTMGAFLDRRYGTGLYASLIGCNVGVSTTSWGCLDGLILGRGGRGFADEFARMGASTFARLPALGTPDGYGFPQAASGTYTLSAIDPSTMPAAPPPAALGPTFLATSHTFQVDAIPSGRTTYVRNGLTVPPGTVVLLVIR